MKITLNCEYCNLPITREIGNFNRSRHHFCNQSCRNRQDYKNGMNKLSKAHQTLREKGHYKRDNTYLKENNPAKKEESRKKISEAKLKNNYMKGRFGSLNHGFKGGKILYRGFDWDNIKKQAKIRDKYKCLDCGMTEEISIKTFKQVLQVHHINLYRNTKNNSLDNLQTLCCRCHGAKQKTEYLLPNQK